MMEMILKETPANILISLLTQKYSTESFDKSVENAIWLCFEFALHISRYVVRAILESQQKIRVRFWKSSLFSATTCTYHFCQALQAICNLTIDSAVLSPLKIWCHINNIFPSIRIDQIWVYADWMQELLGRPCRTCAGSAGKSHHNPLIHRKL